MPKAFEFAEGLCYAVTIEIEGVGKIAGTARTMISKNSGNQNLNLSLKAPWLDGSIGQLGMNFTKCRAK